MLLLRKIVALGVLAAVTTLCVSGAPLYKYEFDPTTATGIEGAIVVDYAPHGGASEATIYVNLNFRGVDAATIHEFDNHCEGEVTKYKWHIHVDWNSNETSQSLEQCGKPLTGNHYDPLYACGPNSEYVDTPECRDKTPHYDCTPKSYAANPLACEKGDLSGKFGDFELDHDKQVSGKWKDEHYPTVEENTPEWNMILHAVCGKATPRIACARGKLTQREPVPVTNVLKDEFL